MRLKSLFLAVLMLLACALPALAAGPTFNIGTISGTPGQQVIVPVTLTNNDAAAPPAGTGTGIAALAIDIGYDPVKLSVPMNTAGTAPLAATRGPAITVTDEAGEPIKNIAQSVPSPGVLRIGISGTNTIAIGNGVVVNVKFNVLAAASGAVALTNTPSASNPAGNSVTITGAAGQINAPVVTTYTVTYNGNGSTGGAVPTDSNSYTSGASVTVLGNTGTLVKTGSTFGGWNTAANGSGTSYAAGNTFTISANTTLYAKWTALPTYTVTYNGNGNTGGIAPVDAASPYVAGSTVTVLTAGTLVKTANSFTGWNTAANGSGTAYAAAATFTINAATTLYAQWTEKPAPNLTITAPANNAITADSTIVVTGTATKATGGGNVAGVNVNGVAADFNQSTGAFSITVTINPNVANPITVVASDTTSPAATNTQLITVISDKLPPTLGITSPPLGLRTKGSVTVTGSVSDLNGIESLKVNNLTATVPTAPSTTYSYSLDLSSYTEGDVVITVEATDKAGNKTPVTRAIVYDKTPLTLTVTEPTNDMVTKQASIPVNGAVTGNVAGETVTVDIKNGSTTATATVKPDYTYEGTIGLTEGDNTIVVTATDQAGNLSTQQSRTVKRDSIAPSLSITDPGHDLITTATTYKVIGTVTDTTPPVTVSLSFNGATFTPAVNATTGSFEQDITIPATEKQYQVVVTATDSLDNPPSEVKRNIVKTAHPADTNDDTVTTRLVEVLKAAQFVFNGVVLTDVEKARLDVAPIGADGKPNPNGTVNAGDIIVLLHRVVGLTNW